MAEQMNRGQERDRFADFLHSSINHNIALADRKAGIIFTLVSAVLIYLFQVRPPALSAAESGVQHVLWLAVLVLLLASASGAFMVVLPRMRPRGSKLTFFGRITDFEDPARYRETVYDEPPGGLTDAKLTHCHVLADICCAKYRSLRLSMVAAGLGLLLFLALSAGETIY